ncbi:NUDIX domain-containing protein [Candidatus Daviesbacteria bacterium]|nr:NUDIX domain-containing protein [Candidatus Daviesbacteria bacterium]
MESLIIFDSFNKPHKVKKSEIIKRRSAYGIYIQNNKVLLIMDSFAKKWEFPGGGLEEGEGDLEGLEREFYEETGLKLTGEIQLIKNLKGYFYNLPWKLAWETDRYFYLIRKVSGGKILTKGNGTDTLAAKYFKLDNLPVDKIKPEYIEILNLALYN